MSLNRVLHWGFILITIAFISIMMVEFLSCFHLQEGLYGGVPSMNITAYNYYVEENRRLIEKIVTLTHWGMGYGLVGLIYWIIKGKTSAAQ